MSQSGIAASLLIKRFVDMICDKSTSVIPSELRTTPQSDVVSGLKTDTSLLTEPKPEPAVDFTPELVGACGLPEASKKEKEKEKKKKDWYIGRLAATLCED
ncbi:hypothetical protein ColLi_07160 [Colletotrichum liriopes]|uniref:Uncharacterized protein n=1 Tax=Colletotrichum liriopes TaxID=708192 RepID=A0AA37GP11_9PEZI|nr:hypothetical protein ColLi_07160 [Colletotrichum liriopes]